MFAQADFSGNWKLNNSKNNLGGEFTAGPHEVKIKQSGNDLNILKYYGYQGRIIAISEKFSLDGKECTDLSSFASPKKSTYEWLQNKELLKITSRVSLPDGGNLTIIEENIFIDKSLAINTVTQSLYGEMKGKMVYDKL